MIKPTQRFMMVGVLVLACTVGCAPPAVPAPEPQEPPAAVTSPPPAPNLAKALRKGNKASAGAKPKEASAEETPRPGRPEAHSAPDNADIGQKEESRKVAAPGVGKKGSRYGGGVVSQPVSTYFGARERIAFINVQRAMRTFEALHERKPESHEEFMEQIVKENGISLPGLFEGERYEYDPESGELMVVKSKS